MQIDMIEDYELEFIHLLTNKGIEYNKAAVSILIFFREFPRPSDELAALLGRFSPNLTEQKVNEAIEWMVDKSLISYENNAYKSIKINTDFPDIIETISGITSLSHELEEKKKEHPYKIKFLNLGKVSSSSNYTSLLNLMKTAQESIKYPMLSTTCYNATAQVLEELASRGVKVYLLIGSDSIVKKIKGNAFSSKAQSWIERFKNVRNVEIRIFSNFNTAELCSSILIDDKKIRLVIYDPMTVTSLDGILLEIENQRGQEINAITWFKDKFDASWLLSEKNNKNILIKFITNKLFLSLVVLILLIKSYFYFSETKIDIMVELVLIVLGINVSYIGSIIYLWATPFIKKIIQAFKTE